MKNYHLYLILGYFLFLHQAQTQTISFFPDTIFACKTDSVLLSIPKEFISKSVNIQWITPYSIIYHASSISAHQPGKYILQLKTKQSEIADTVLVVKNEAPAYKITDTVVCAGKQTRIHLHHPIYRFYLPNTKINIQELTIDKPGTYSINIDNKGCTSTQEFDVKQVFPTIPEHKEYTFCMNDENKKITLKHNGISTIQWSNGSTQKSIVVDKEGEYWVKTSDIYCGTRIDTVYLKLKACNCEVLVPNAFTPNEDGKNDYFYPILSCDYSYYNLTIYDKWNNIVFSTNNPTAKWDGRYKGNLLPEDIYIYKLETTEKNSSKKNIRSGKIALIR